MESKFHNLTKLSLLLVYLVIIAGAFVRMTGSGMGCPDWPKCFGFYVPPTEVSQILFKANNDYSKGKTTSIKKGISSRVNKDNDVLLIAVDQPRSIDLIKIGLTKNSPISKYFFDLCVEAPQYLSLGTFIDPILSNSLRNFIDSYKLFIY